MKKTIAVLDKDNVLTGFKKVNTVGEKDIQVPDECDLNTDRRYKWTGREFMALGYGYTKPRPPANGGVNKEQAVFLMMKALVNDTPIPQECKDWVEWYEQNLKKRSEEKLKGGGNK